MRSKTYMSKINLQRGILTVENRRSREKKPDMLRSIGKQSGESGEKLGTLLCNPFHFTLNDSKDMAC